MSCQFLLRGVFQTQGPKLHLLCLLLCRQILYRLSHLLIVLQKSFFYFLESSPFFLHMQRFSPQPVYCLSFHILTSAFFFFKQCRSLSVQFSSVTQSYPTLCDPMDCSMPGPLSITNSQSLLKLMSIELVMPSNHLILCRRLLLQPSIFASIRVFSNESALHIRWPKCWSFSFSISHSNEHSGLISFRMD